MKEIEIEEKRTGGWLEVWGLEQGQGEELPASGEEKSRSSLLVEVWAKVGFGCPLSGNGSGTGCSRRATVRGGLAGWGRLWDPEAGSGDKGHHH